MREGRDDQPRCAQRNAPKHNGCLLDAVTWEDPSVAVVGAVVSVGSTVPVQHDTAFPSEKSHRVGLASARGEPRMGGSVSELVRMQLSDTRRRAATPEYLRHAAGG